VVFGPLSSTTSGRGSGRTDRATQVRPSTAITMPPAIAITRHSTGSVATVTTMIGSSSGRAARELPNTP
jgi:hypothetical protein